MSEAPGFKPKKSVALSGTVAGDEFNRVLRGLA